MEESRTICLGCGAELQSDYKHEPGYIPNASLLEREDILCRRCFRLKHYNETEEVSMTNEDFLKMISEIRYSESLIIHLIDLFDIDGSYVDSLPRIVGDQKIVLVGNKLDLLPKSVNRRRLEHWLRSLTNDRGIKVTDVFLISSKKGTGINKLKTSLDHYRKDRDIYIVGTTNVGKSTFINYLIKDSTDVENAITTSYFPGTTLGFIEIPLDETSFLIDTPGIVNPKQISHYVSEKDLKMIMPEREIKPRVYQIEEKQTLYFGGLARLDFIRGKRSSFISYFSNQLPIHRTKLENAENLYEKHLGKLLSPPNEETLKILPPLRKNTFKLPSEDTDIVFPGLGWVTIKGGGVTVESYSPEPVAVTIRRSLFS